MQRKFIAAAMSISTGLMTPALAQVAGSSSQSSVGIPLKSDAPLTQEEIEKRKAQDSAYQAGYPEDTRQEGVRRSVGRDSADRTDVEEQAATAIGWLGAPLHFRRMRCRCYKDGRADQADGSRAADVAKW